MMCDVTAGDSSLVSFSFSMLHNVADFTISAIVEKITFLSTLTCCFKIFITTFVLVES